MPVGIIINSFAISGHKIPSEIKIQLNLIFGLSAMMLGITSIGLVKNISAVVLAMIIGTIVGISCKVGVRINQLGQFLERPVSKFSSGGNGGLSHSILIVKSILDFFTAAIFACNVGYVVSLVAVPQFITFFSLYLFGTQILPLANPVILADFRACGGMIMLATGFRIIKVKMFPVADMIPAMLLVMPISWGWVNWILPLISQ